MAIRSLRDVNLAFAEGRVHTSPFLKNAQGGSDGVWYDWSYIAGKPGYDARIGDAASLTPFVAQRNDALYLPPIGALHERKLAGFTLSTIASGNNSVATQFALYDLLAVYPLIDGDSTDAQPMDNTQPLPRYADGNGVQIAFVCHVSPMLTNADGTMEYVDCEGATHTTGFRVNARTNGQNCTATYVSGGAGGAGPIYVQLASGCRGVRQINWIQFATAPGGLIAAYMVRPLADMAVIYNNRANDTRFPPIEVDLCRNNAWNMPRVYDGAWLGFWFMGIGGSRTRTIFGTAKFIWG